MKYSEYPYERIDLDKFKNKIELMINDFSNAESPLCSSITTSKVASIV